VARVSVIGIGNVLTGDDAVGPTVVREIEARYELPDDVEVIDAGTPGSDLTVLVAGRDGVVLVDALRARGPAGEVRVLDRAALLDRGPVLALSPHEPGVREALLHAELLGVTPPVVRLVGVVAARTETGIGLSSEVRAAIPAAVSRVAAELSALGIHLRERTPPREPDLWWER
jgi:hydrogenase maturation protease